MAYKLVLLGYGFLLFFGAYFGWKAGSKVSLIMGLVSGAIILIGIFVMSSNPQLGYMIATAVSAILSLVFLMRLLKTHAFMPSGMLFLVSAAVLALCISQLMKIR